MNGKKKEGLKNMGIKIKLKCKVCGLKVKDHNVYSTFKETAESEVAKKYGLVPVGLTYPYKFYICIYCLKNKVINNAEARGFKLCSCDPRIRKHRRRAR